MRPKSERALSPGNSATPEVTSSEYNEANTLHLSCQSSLLGLKIDMEREKEKEGM